MSESAGRAKPVRASILDQYVMSFPTNQNAIDIFSGEWASSFPPPFNNLSAGRIPLFQDTRMTWALDRLGGVQGQTILELGPLEGGHAFVLERAGAAHITSIEANSRAYLKCLIAKEILNLSRTRFLCGDFTAYMEQTGQLYDLILASGMLYHMKDPLHTLDLIARHTNRLYIWTHYYDEKIIKASPTLRGRFKQQKQVALGHTEVTEYRQDYLQSLDEKTYCGGSAEYSTWLSRDGLMTALTQFGFNDFQFGFEMPDHDHGPALSLVAQRR